MWATAKQLFSLFDRKAGQVVPSAAGGSSQSEIAVVTAVRYGLGTGDLRVQKKRHIIEGRAEVKQDWPPDMRHRSWGWCPREAGRDDKTDSANEDLPNLWHILQQHNPSGVRKCANASSISTLRRPDLRTPASKPVYNDEYPPAATLGRSVVFRRTTMINQERQTGRQGEAQLKTKLSVRNAPYASPTKPPHPTKSGY